MARNQGEAKARVVIADDHAIFVDALRMFLESSRRFEVVGAAATGSDAIDLAVDRDADLVLMDVTMPGMDGFEATRRLLARRPATQVVIVSGLDHRDLADKAAASGAVAFVPKDRVATDLIELMGSLLERHAPPPADLAVVVPFAAAPAPA